MKIRRGGLLLFAVALRDEQEELVLRHCGFYGGEGGSPADEERDDDIRENDNIPERQHRDAIGCRNAFVVPLEYLGHVLETRERRSGKLVAKMPGCGDIGSGRLSPME